MNDRQLLADFIEGLLSEEETANVQSRLDQEPELAIQFNELKAFFEEEGTLPELPVPPGLYDVTLATLEFEGLVSPSPESSSPDPIPGNLVAATMDRLEVEGLVQPITVGQRSPFFSFLGLFLALLLAFGGGWWLRPFLNSSEGNDGPKGSPSRATIHGDELDDLRLEVKVLKNRLRGIKSLNDGKENSQSLEIVALKHSTESLTEQLRKERRKLAQLTGREQELTNRLSKVVEESEQIEKSLAAALESAKTRQLEKNSILAVLAGKELELTQSLTREEQQRIELTKLNSKIRLELSDKKRLKKSALALKERLNKIEKGSVQTPMVVKDAQHLDYWDGAWKSVSNGVKLAPGTLLRAESSRTMLRFGQRSLRLVAGYFQVTGADRLIAVPLNSAAPDDEIVASRQSGSASPEGSREDRLNPIQGIFDRLRN